MSVISVKDVKKKFRVYYDKGSSLKEKILFQSRNRHEDRMVLKGISFEVEKGEAIGLIGQNGCGKSTMLKLLAKIMYPDAGKIEIQGRVSSLIELGAGFHPDLTGRENIYTNASIFGLNRKEIDERMDEIIAFSELGDFVDSPVRIYSSGMYMRLAFSVAVNVDADVLLVDEILAVGDASFQTKCINKLQEIKNQGTTIVIVSHSLGSVEQFCDRSYWICDGLVRMVGRPRDVHPAYLEYMATKDHGVEGANIPAPETEKARDKATTQGGDENTGEKEAQEKVDAPAKKELVLIHNVETKNEMGKVTSRYATGESITLSVDYELTQPENDVILGIAVYRLDGLHCYGSNLQIEKKEPLKLSSGKHHSTVVLEHVPLLGGEYLLDWALTREDGSLIIYKKDIAKFTVYNTAGDVGAFRISHRWGFDTQE